MKTWIRIVSIVLLGAVGTIGCGEEDPHEGHDHGDGHEHHEGDGHDH